MEEDGVKCFVVISADDLLGRRVIRVVRVIALKGAESYKHHLPESCVKDDQTHHYAKSKAFESESGVLTDSDSGQKWPKGQTQEDGKLHRSEKLLVPNSMVLELCGAWRQHMIIPGVKEQALDMKRRFEIDEIGLHNAIKQIQKGCVVCQAWNPDKQNVKEEAQ